VRWANAAVRDGGPATASAAGVALPVSAVAVCSGLVVALTRPGAALPSLAGCDDVPGDLSLLRRDRRAVLDVRLQGWWRPLSTVEVAGRAADLAGVAPVWALADPWGWVERAPVLGLDVAGAVVHVQAPGRPPVHLTLDDEQAAALLLATARRTTRNR
jgi:hypothetical protein